MFYCYILKCSAGIFYTGITNNIVRRLSEHQSGQSKFTSRFTNWSLILWLGFSTRADARAQEIIIKKQGARRFLLRFAIDNSCPELLSQM